MADNTIGTNGTGTLPVSGPGVVSTVTVTDAAVIATDRIFLTLTNAVKDQEGTFDAYVSTTGAGSFVVTCNRAQLPVALTFDYLAINTV